MKVENEAEAEGLKEIVGPAMRLMNEVTKDIVPKNVVAEFVEKELPHFFEGSDEMAAGFLVKMQIEEANQQPKVVLKKFLNFYNAFREFYVGLEKSAEADKNPPVKEEEDGSTTEDTDQE